MHILSEDLKIFRITFYKKSNCISKKIRRFCKIKSDKSFKKPARVEQLTAVQNEKPLSAATFTTELHRILPQ